MEYIISFSLFKDAKYDYRLHEYLVGVLANVQARNRYFPTFTLLFYIDNRLKNCQIVKYLQTLKQVQVIFKTFQTFADAVQWRYIPIFEHSELFSETKVVLVRDVDSVLSAQDAFYVNKWLEANEKPFFFYREYLMSFLCCGGGVNVNFNAMSSDTMEYISKRAKKFKYKSIDLFFVPDDSDHPERGLDEDKLNYVFDYIEEDLIQEIVLRADEAGRYHEHKKDDGAIIFESVSFVLDYNPNTQSWSECNDNALVQIARSPHSFLWPNTESLAELSKRYVEVKGGIEWIR